MGCVSPRGRVLPVENDLDPATYSTTPEAWLGEPSDTPSPSDLPLLCENLPHSQAGLSHSPPPPYSEAAEDGQVSLSRSFTIPPRLTSSGYGGSLSSTFGSVGLRLPLDMMEHDSSLEQMPDSPQHPPMDRLTGTTGEPTAPAREPLQPDEISPRPPQVFTHPYPRPSSPVVPFQIVNPWMSQSPYQSMAGSPLHNPWLVFPSVLPTHPRGWLPHPALSHMPMPANPLSRLPPLQPKPAQRKRKKHRRRRHHHDCLSNHSHLQQQRSSLAET